MEKYRNKLLYVLIVLVFLSVFWGWFIFSGSNDNAMVISGEKKEQTSELQASDSLAADAVIMVYITGAVKTPGVVSLAADSRLVEAIQKVGGLTENADGEAINLARRLKDEEKIHIPVIGESATQGGEEADGRVNINTASLEELKKLPGVGDVIAQGIIDYREKNGGFTDLEELKNVNRIGEKIYEGLSELIVL